MLLLFTICVKRKLTSVINLGNKQKNLLRTLQEEMFVEQGISLTARTRLQNVCLELLTPASATNGCHLQINLKKYSKIKIKKGSVIFPKG
jgi:hypothetical protein